MPLPVAPFVVALLGIAFALVGRDEIRRTTTAPTATRGFLVLMAVTVALIAPALGYFLAFYPDWAWSYLVPGSRVPSAIDLVAVVVVAAVGPLGFWWTAAALRRHAVRALVRGASALVVAFAIVLAILGPRLLVAATYTAYRGGYDLRPTTGSPLGVSILWIDACLFAGVAWALSRIRGIGRA